MDRQPLTYAQAGVDVEAGDRAVSLMRSAVEATHGPRVLGGIGGFAGLWRLAGDSGRAGVSADPVLAAAIVAGVAEGCRRARCALLGGETAEHPDAMDPDAYDLAGFALGVVDRDRLLGPDRVVTGDVLLGLGSSGLHANGFSLARQVLARAGVGYGRDLPE